MRLQRYAETGNSYEETVCALDDEEGSFDAPWAKQRGVDVARLILLDFGSGEEAFDGTNKLMREGAFDVLIMDSLASLVATAASVPNSGDGKEKRDNGTTAPSPAIVPVSDKGMGGAVQ